MLQLNYLQTQFSAEPIAGENINTQQPLATRSPLYPTTDQQQLPTTFTSGGSDPSLGQPVGSATIAFGGLEDLGGALAAVLKNLNVQAAFNRLGAASKTFAPLKARYYNDEKQIKDLEAKRDDLSARGHFTEAEQAQKQITALTNVLANFYNQDYRPAEKEYEAARANFIKVAQLTPAQVRALFPELRNTK